jgi:hypothetical protein
MQQRKICGLAGNEARIRKFVGNVSTQNRWMRQYWLITKNKKWCLQNGIKKVTTENGRTKAYGKMNTQNYKPLSDSTHQVYNKKKTFQRGQEQRCARHAMFRKRRPEDELKRKVAVRKVSPEKAPSKKGTEDEWENIRPSI